MRKKSLWRLYLCVFYVMTGTNIAHPFTPKFVNQSNMPDYMFGVAFASMACGLFLTGAVMGKAQ
jgi:DHA1 family multidrug resistance protein-like MFS transporter